MHAYDYPVWLEKPSIGIARIKFMMSQPVFPFDANRERVNRERQEAEGDGDADTEAQKQAFALLMKAAQKWGLLERGPRILLRPLHQRPGPVDHLGVRQEVR